MQNNYNVSEIVKKCNECGLCAKSCPLLAEIGQSPFAMLNREITFAEAYSCALCDLCTAVCPQGIGLKEVFEARRCEAVSKGQIDISEYQYMFPDRKNNLMSVYRKYAGIDYSDITSLEKADTCFFPGCTLMTYSPQLTRSIFQNLQESCGCQTIWTECCGKSLGQMGLRTRQQQMHRQLRDAVCSKGIRRIIAACPGCYYELQEVFKSSDVVVQTVYEVLNLQKQNIDGLCTCTVHDSCPDRFLGLFAKQVRDAMGMCGFSLVEMPHNKLHTICCGSGGQISHFRPDLAANLIDVRQKEVSQTGARILVGYCLSCVLKFDSLMTGIPSTHALNLILGVEEDFRGAKERVQGLLNGTEGQRIWEEIMAE